MTDSAPIAPEQATTLADRIVAQADAGKFPAPHRMLAKLQGGDFELDGLQVHFKHQTASNGQKLHCHALVGYLPYTAEKPEQRRALHHILLATSRLKRAHFRLDRENRICVEADLPLPPQPEDEDMVLALLDFYQEARPVLKLIAQQL